MHENGFRCFWIDLRLYDAKDPMFSRRIRQKIAFHFFAVGDQRVAFAFCVYDLVNCIPEFTDHFYRVFRFQPLVRQTGADP